MNSVPNDILKSFEIATKALVDATLYDGQILEDRLKYSGWMNALAIGCLLMVSANFSDFVPAGASTMEQLIVLIPITSFIACLAIGGIYHHQVIGEMEALRVQVSLLLKQHSLALSSAVTLKDHIPLCEQVWAREFLSKEDRDSFAKLRSKKGARSNLIYVQAGVVASGALLLVALLFVHS